MHRLCFPLVALWVAILLHSGGALALEVTPLLREFTPSGPGATQAFELLNEGSAPIALELSFMKREVNQEGRDTLTPAADDFLIFPEQFILSPGQRQTVRASWVGDPAPRSELSYRIIFEQLPVQALDGGALETVRGQVQFIIKFVGSVYIRPPGAQPQIQLKSVAMRRDAKGAPGLELVLSNTGPARGMILDLALTLTQTETKQSVVLTGERLEPLRGTLVHAGSQRLMLVAWPPELVPGPIEGSLKVLRVK